MRRSWIKIYTDILRGKTIKELNPAERWIWVGLLAAAGDSGYDGIICFTEDMGYTDEQLAKLLNVDLDVFITVKLKMASQEMGKITVDKNNIITINNWHLYQSEFSRQKPYRDAKKLQEQVTNNIVTKSYSPELPLDKIRLDKIRKDIIINKEDFKSSFNKKYKNQVIYDAINGRFILNAIEDFTIDLKIQYPDITEDILLKQLKNMAEYLSGHPEKIKRADNAWVNFILYWLEKYQNKIIINNLTAKLAGAFTMGGK